MSTAKYIPRAKLEAERRAAEQAANGETATTTTVTDGDTTTASSETTPFSTEELAEFTPARRWFYDQSDIFKRLQHAKKQFGDKPEVENMFNQHRANNVDKKVGTKFADQFYVCMDDINETAGSLLTNDSVKAYLDLGCSPGGFSTWVMANNRECRQSLLHGYPRLFANTLGRTADSLGLGITLPEEKGGLPLVSHPDGDYQVSFLDITQLDEARKIITTRHPKGVDLVMAACIYRDTETALPRVDGKPPIESRTPPGARTILSLSQIILALDHLQDEGHFVFVLSNKPDPATIQVLVFLRSLFKSIVPCKGKNLHGIRSSFYLFCDQFDRAAYEARDGSQVLKDALRKVDEAEVNFQTESLSVDEQQSQQRAKPSTTEPVHPADIMWLPGMTLESMLEREGNYVSGFFEKLWLGQIKAIDRRIQELEYRRKPNHHSNHGGGNSGRFGGQSYSRRGGEDQQQQQQHPAASSAALEASDWRSAKPSPSRSNWQAPSPAANNGSSRWQDSPRRNKSHAQTQQQQQSATATSTPVQPKAPQPSKIANAGPPKAAPRAPWAPKTAATSASTGGGAPPGLTANANTTTAPTPTRTTILPNNAIPPSSGVIPVKSSKSTIKSGSAAFDWSQRPLGKELPH